MATKTPDSPQITVGEAAKYLDVRAAHVTLLLRAGTLAGMKWSGDWVVESSSVVRYLEKYRRPKMGRPRTR